MDQIMELMRDGKTWGLGSQLLMMQQMLSDIFTHKCSVVKSLTTNDMTTQTKIKHRAIMITTRTKIKQSTIMMEDKTSCQGLRI